MLAFDRAAMELPWMTTGTVGIRVSPANLVYRVYEQDGSMSDAGLSFQRNGNRVYVTSLREGSATGTLYVATPDGRLESACRITTVEPPVTLKRIVLRCVDSPTMTYYEYLDTYEIHETWYFAFEADLYYSDGSSETGVTDFSEFEWMIADEDVVYPYSGHPELLTGLEPGLTTVSIMKGTCVRTRSTSVCIPRIYLCAPFRSASNAAATAP